MILFYRLLPYMERDIGGVFAKQQHSIFGATTKQRTRDDVSRFIDGIVAGRDAPFHVSAGKIVTRNGLRNGYDQIKTN